MKKTNSTKEYKLSKLIEKKHEGNWVAISSDYKKILGYSKDLLKLQGELKTTDVIYTKPLLSDMTYAFSF